MNNRQSFEKLMERMQKVTAWSYLDGLYEWDQNVNCPPQAGQYRGLMSALAAEAGHRAFIDPEIGQLINEAITNAWPRHLTALEQRVLLRLQSSYHRSLAVPAEVVGQMEADVVMSHTAWEQAKRERAFVGFAPHLAKMVANTRQLVRYYGTDPNNAHALYDTLLEDYEPGMNTAVLLPIMNQVRSWLVAFLKRVTATSSPDLVNLVANRDFPVESQLAIGRQLLPILGFDLNRGHYGVSVHPFSSTVGPKDHRITTDLDPRNLFSLWSTAHEAGHAMFDQGAPEVLDWVGVPCSMGIHESQSRMWENIVCRGRAFSEYFYPKLAKQFSCLTESVGEFYRGINLVKPSLIRVEADEVTYNLHILMRFETELALLSGELRAEDASVFFAGKQEEYLGLRPHHDAEGILQDVHWSEGLFGYFPTYLLGNLASAQLFKSFTRQSEDWVYRFSLGDFTTLHQWLQTHVYPYGHTMSLNELLVQATGEPLNPQYWFRYIEQKYGELYNL